MSDLSAAFSRKGRRVFVNPWKALTRSSQPSAPLAAANISTTYSNQLMSTIQVMCGYETETKMKINPYLFARLLHLLKQLVLQVPEGRDARVVQASALAVARDVSPF